MTKREIEIMDKCVERWGVQSQLLLLLEEVAELQIALTSIMNRGECDYDNVAEEIADVRIMLDQVEHIFGIAKMIQYYREHKLERLEARLAGKKIRKRRM